MDSKVYVSIVLDYHSAGKPKGKPGLIAIICDRYYAWWEWKYPGKLFVRESGEKRYNILELSIGGVIETEDVECQPEAGSFGLISPTIEQRTNGMETHYELDEFEMVFACEDKNGNLYKYMLDFYTDRIENRLAFHKQNENDFRIRKCTIGTDVYGNKTRVDGEYIFSPTPMTNGIYYHPLSYRALSGSNTEKWFSPGPFCFPVKAKHSESWISFSLEPDSSQLDFAGFNTIPDKSEDIAFEIEYSSLPKVKGGKYESPPLVVRLGAGNEFEALKNYADGLIKTGKVQKLHRNSIQWWKGIMMCGWHEQMAYGKSIGKKGQEVCTQEVYEKHIQRLEHNKIKFDMITIDDFWGKEQGIWEVDKEKWIDLRSFIEKQHSLGRKVLLWVCISTDGILEEELYITSEGKMLDPCNRMYMERVRKHFKTMFGSDAGCYNADGIKLDFTGGYPKGKILQSSRELHGMTYLYELFKLFHDAAKEVKADCLLDFQIANPHFAELHDMTRINDYYLYEGNGNAVRTMSTRCKIAEAVTYGAMIDTDGMRHPEYFEHMHKFGNMSLYLTNEDLNKEDWVERIRESQKE